MLPVGHIHACIFPLFWKCAKEVIRTVCGWLVLASYERRGSATYETAGVTKFMTGPGWCVNFSDPLSGTFLIRVSTLSRGFG